MKRPLLDFGRHVACVALKIRSRDSSVRTRKQLDQQITSSCLWLVTCVRDDRSVLCCCRFCLCRFGLDLVRRVMSCAAKRCGCKAHARGLLRRCRLALLTSFAVDCALFLCVAVCRICSSSCRRVVTPTAARQLCLPASARTPARAADRGTWRMSQQTVSCQCLRR